MAKSATERSRELRARRKAADKVAPDLSHHFLNTPFFRALKDDGNWSSVELCFDMMGFDPPVFDDDSGPRSRSGIVEDDGEVMGFDPHMGARDSLGRAENMVHLLLDAATELAGIINRHKLNEIEARIAEITQADLSAPAAKVQALEDIVTLKAIKARLDGKTFRRSFAEFSVKGNASN